MKKLFKISFLFIVLCWAASAVYAEGDMPTGSRTCTQNCGLYESTDPNPPDADEKTSGAANQDDSTVDEIYSWLYKQISELVD